MKYTTVMTKKLQNLPQIGLLEFNVSFVTVTDISRPCQPEKLIPLLPGPGFDPSFSGHNDEQSSASGQDYASDRSAI